MRRSSKAFTCTTMQNVLCGDRHVFWWGYFITKLNERMKLPETTRLLLSHEGMQAEREGVETTI